MTRQEYLRAHKDSGKPVLGVFPAQYPREIIWALGAVPAEIWDPPLPSRRADAHLQPYICPVVKCGLELVLSGAADLVDGFVFPHTCDSIQNLASVVHDYLGLDKPCYFFYHPKAPYRASSRVYYQAQLHEFAQRLCQDLGPLDPERLREAVGQGQELARLAGQLHARRAAGELPLSNAEFYALTRQVEWLLPQDLLPAWQAALDQPSPAPASGPAVVLSGVLAHPPQLLELLDQLGVRVAHDDLLAGSRRLLAPPVTDPDPWRALSQAYFGLPPCSSKGSPLAERLAWLEGLVRESRAGGVIFNTVKFCEPELFEVPILARELKERGLPVLVMDSELNQGLGGQMATRVEAFVEMIG